MRRPFLLAVVCVLTSVAASSLLTGIEVNKAERFRPPFSFLSFQGFSDKKINEIKEQLQQLQIVLNPRSKPINSVIGFKPLGKKKKVDSHLNTIVSPQDQISEFEAKFELAKILARHKNSWKEALRLYAELQREKPNHFQLWLEISRLYIAQGQFHQALYILSALLNRETIHFHFPLENSSLAMQEYPRGQNSLLPGVDTSTIVPLEDQIDDDHARLELARVLSHNDKHLDEAIAQYQILLQKKPHDPILVLEISRLYIRQKHYSLALSLLYPALTKNPENVDLLVETAHAEHALKHPKQTQDLLLKALALAKDRKPILIDYASSLMLIGSYYKAEAIYREILNAEPESLDAALNLAGALLSAQRYEEAEGIYRKLLLKYGNHSKILEALVTLKRIEKDFDSALDFIDALLVLDSQESSYWLLKAETLYKKESYLEALEIFDYLANDSKYRVKALIGKGKIYRKLGKCEEAEESFREANAFDSDSIEAQFYAAGEEVTQATFIHSIIERTSDPEKLMEWTNVYIENGMAGITEFYEAILKIDADYFPAKVGLASALSANYQYDKAVEIYLSILADFPEDSKIMMEIARVFSWAKSYECSMKWYDQIIALNPQDPVPRREKARVAYWGNFIDRSMATYQGLLEPPVDQLLINALQELSQGTCGECIPLQSMNCFSPSVAVDSIYTGYEQLSLQFADFANQWEPNEKSQVEAILVEYLPQYRIQKSAYLESRAKYLDWQGYSLHALPVYGELTDFSPGNEEALYSYAQDYCALGLCKCSRQLYEHILNIDPNHNLVKMALERNRLREHPLVQGNYTYWRERGIGQFSQSQIARQQWDELVEWSPSCDYHFRFIQREWLEFPFFTEKYYPAEGQSIEVDHVFNGYVKGVASATRKNYFHKFPSRYSCFSTLWFNLYDYVNLGIGFERRDEIYNYFTLKQGIQAKVYWLSLKANSHSWETATTYRHYDYNDANTLDHINLLISHSFTEDPTIFRVILNANYRNTAHLTRVIVDPSGDVVNVIHPYWTPRNYYSGSVTFQFRYNYAYFNYCEGPQRYFDLKVSGLHDTADNPSVQVTFDWKHECMYHWGFELLGFMQRGKLWNGDGFWALAYYRF